MDGYKVTISEAMREKLSALKNRFAFNRALDKLIEEIRESPRSRGGVLYTGRQWTYGVMVYKIKAIIDDDNKTVELTDMFRLP